MVLGPDRPAVGRERWLVALIAVSVIAMLAAETVRDFRPGKLSALVMVLSLGPLVLIHEAGHALASHIAGWRVCHIVVGRGRPMLRLHAGGVPVDVHWIPVGGHVLPAPARLRYPRAESAFIYAAGPGAELLLALAIAFGTGPARVLRETTEVSVIVAQSVLLLIAIDLVFNLLPLPAIDVQEGALSDGLGLLLAPFRPRWHFVRLLTLPWRMRAEESSIPAERARIYENGVRHYPDNPFMHLLLADAYEAAGKIYDARSHRLRALQSPELPRPWVDRLRERVGAG
ncbi:MAG: M50 family metallopeptidase [Polyangiaceae bacterium]|nr:M50 family metallopeptidase [Polyangiaceae bacterium]